MKAHGMSYGSLEFAAPSLLVDPNAMSTRTYPILECLSNIPPICFGSLCIFCQDIRYLAYQIVSQSGPLYQLDHICTLRSRTLGTSPIVELPSITISRVGALLGYRLGSGCGYGQWH